MISELYIAESLIIGFVAGYCIRWKATIDRDKTIRQLKKKIRQYENKSNHQ